MTTRRTTVKTLYNIEKSLSILAVLSNWCVAFGRRTVQSLVDMSYENSVTYEILSFKITSTLRLEVFLLLNYFSSSWVKVFEHEHTVLAMDSLMVGHGISVVDNFDVGTFKNVFPLSRVFSDLLLDGFLYCIFLL